MSGMTRKEMLPYLYAKWYGYIFSLFYILYGGVSIVLGMLDRNYEGLELPFFSLLFGIILAIITHGFAEKKRWGWKGLIAINCGVLIFAAFGLKHPETYVLILFSALALIALFARQTKKCLR
ncbi:MAG: hypothetical protein JSU65_13460 [Candidatus Zixiibacteriota bacterium]|nr:MAG: hypothetical protein JSU65_13460 [candidate division Zixibacteria bacterium]